MMRFSWCPFGIVLGFAFIGPAAQGPIVKADEQPEFSDQQIEYFENEIRPLLVKRCHKCHGSDEQKGGLRLDSRDAVLKGGDTGPAILREQPNDSELVRAIRYGDDGYQMPPDGKLPQPDIDRLVKWVSMGAPWPATDPSTPENGVSSEIDLEERAKHWSFQPLKRPDIPSVEDREWCRTPVDRFLLASLEEQGIAPAAAADRNTWLRRASLDVIGLPPTPGELAEFLADDSPQADERVTERLLTSPHFGERWGRHWLDLVRYAESRGHEFDYDVANPWHYRDYVIRAINDDVPYDQFVVEHVAGDLLTRTNGESGIENGENVPVLHSQSSIPHSQAVRLHPQSGANESILATGFWYLGEWVHSPVDIRQDEADRFANMIDVYSKTFLGLTVACARCHDHKFDPITQKDFYALQGYLQSTTYRQARFETMEHNSMVADEERRMHRDMAAQFLEELADLAEPIIDDLDEYLMASRDLIQAGVETYPDKEDIIFADFETGTYEGWELEGDAFGTQPQTLETIADYQGKINVVGTYFVNSHQRRDGGQGDKHIGVMTSEPFVIDRNYIRMRVGGGNHQWRTCVLLLVDDEIPRSATGRNDNQMHDITWDVRAYRGRTARIRIIDNEKGSWGNIGVDHIVFSDENEEGVSVLTAESFQPESRKRIRDKARELSLDEAILGNWVGHLLTAQHDESDPFYLWGAYSTGVIVNIRDVLKTAQRLLWDYSSGGITHWDEPGVDNYEMTPEPRFAWTYRNVAIWEGPQFDGRPLNEPPCLTDEWWELNPNIPQPVSSGMSSAEPGATSVFANGVRLRTSTLPLESGKLHCLIRGGVNTYVAVDSHILINGPLHGSLVQQHPAPDDKRWRWITLDMSRYTGHRAHIEFAPRQGEDFAIAIVVQSADAPPPVRESFPPAISTLRMGLSGTDVTTARGLARRLQDNFAPDRFRVQVRGGGFSGPHKDIRWMLQFGYSIEWHRNWIAQHPDLLLTATPYYDDGTPTEILRELREVHAVRGSEIASVSAVAPAMLDGSGEDEYVFIRGNWKKQGDVVPRRFLEVFHGELLPSSEFGSGRLELAEQMVNPIQTPILPRVIVNRIWQHYFGLGLVTTPDDFGHMGRPPSHPELLDWLACELVDHDWSLKHIHRLILNSAAYRMSSSSDPALSGNEQLSQPSTINHQPSTTDPQLFARMPVKRLEGEIIRDAMLRLSGRLDDSLYGRGVPVHLTPFMEGRGRPAESGPVDGAGRRSLYIAVRRNFPDPFFQAFDMPNPHTTTGRRTVSNVPAQALAMMNNPMVIELSRQWAERLLSELPDGKPEVRIRHACLACVSREPTENELATAIEFVSQHAEDLGTTSDDPRIWGDLCQVLLNTKEFLFVQ